MIWLKLGLRSASAAPRFLDGLLGWMSLIGALLLLFLGVTQMVPTRLLGDPGWVGFLIMMLTIVGWSGVATLWFSLRPGSRSHPEPSLWARLALPAACE